MHCRVRYLLHFYLKIRSGQVWQCVKSYSKQILPTIALEVEDGIIATTTTDMVVDPQTATTITEAICTPVEITTVIVLDMAAKIMVIMGEAYSTITTHLEACLEEEGILLHWEPVQDFWVELWQVSQLCLCTTGIYFIFVLFCPTQG